MLGFDPDLYTVSEDAGIVTLTIRVFSGMLQTEVSTEFYTSLGTAVGKLA